MKYRGLHLVEKPEPNKVAISPRTHDRDEYHRRFSVMMPVELFRKLAGGFEPMWSFQDEHRAEILWLDREESQAVRSSGFFLQQEEQ
jgi:hypothetical protein